MQSFALELLSVIQLDFNSVQLSAPITDGKMDVNLFKNWTPNLTLVKMTCVSGDSIMKSLCFITLDTVCSVGRPNQAIKQILMTQKIGAGSEF